MAATQAPSGSQPTARHTPSHGDGSARPGRAGARRSAASSAVGRDRASAAAPAPASRDDEVDQPVVDLDVDDAAAVGRGHRGVAEAAGRLAVLALAVGQDDPVATVGRQADDLEPAARRRRRRGAIRRAASRRPRRGCRVAGDDLAARRSRRPRSRSARCRVGRVACGHDRDAAAVGRPGERRRRRRRRGVRARGLRRLRIALRPPAAWDGRVDHPDLRPAAAARQEGEPAAVGRPARDPCRHRAWRRPASSRGCRRPRRPRSRRRGRRPGAGRRATTAGRRRPARRR